MRDFNEYATFDEIEAYERMAGDLNHVYRESTFSLPDAEDILRDVIDYLLEEVEIKRAAKEASRA